MFDVIIIANVSEWNLSIFTQLGSWAKMKFLGYWKCCREENETQLTIRINLISLNASIKRIFDQQIMKKIKNYCWWCSTVAGGVGGIEKMNQIKK